MTDQPPTEAADPILVIANRHFACCGAPPKLALPPDKYTCYFENRYGEQCVAQYDPAAKEAALWMGDVGWEEPLKVVEFRGKPVVLFVRPQEERDRDHRMNKQFGKPKPADAATAEMIRSVVRTSLQRLYGKPKLTDDEVERLSHAPILNRGEWRMIEALWAMWTE